MPADAPDFDRPKESIQSHTQATHEALLAMASDNQSVARIARQFVRAVDAPTLHLTLNTLATQLDNSAALLIAASKVIPPADVASTNARPAILTEALASKQRQQP